MRIIRTALYFIVAFSGLSLLVIIVTGGQEGLVIAGNAVNKWRIELTMFRLCLIALTYCYWNNIIDFLCSKQDTKVTDHLKSQRWNYIFALLAIELFLVQNVLRHILELF